MRRCALFKEICVFNNVYASLRVVKWNICVFSQVFSRDSQGNIKIVARGSLSVHVVGVRGGGGNWFKVNLKN